MKNQTYINTTSPQIVDTLSTIEKNLQLQSHIAPYEIEGKMTFRVTQIVNSFRKYYRYEDVIERFFILSEDDLRELYHEEEKKNEEKEDLKRKFNRKEKDDADSNEE